MKSLIKGRNSETKKFVEIVNQLLKNGKWVGVLRDERNK
jgi:hypothetical protein